MELHFKIPGEDKETLSFLNKLTGVSAKLKKGRIEGFFQDYEFGSGKLLYVGEFPILTEFYILCWESGGGKTKTGLGTVVCSGNGGKLKPTKIHTEGHLANGIHAEFQEKEFTHVISTKRGVIQITFFSIVLNGNLLTVKVFPLWHGDIHDLPHTYDHFAKAAELAFAKANDYHCRKPYYIKED